MVTTLDRIRDFWPQLPLTGPSPRDVRGVTRDDFAQLLAHLQFNYGVEVGTEFGYYAETLCKANPNLDLHCVDPYFAYREYRDHKSQDKLDEIYRQAQERLRPYRVTFHRLMSCAAAADFKDGSLDWVYLDGNHALPFVIEDLDHWVRKVRKDGIVAGHDFIRRNNRLRYQCHVVEAVHAYTQCYMVKDWWVLGAKDEPIGPTREAIRSWMWVKG